MIQRDRRGPAKQAVCLVPWFSDHNNPRYVELFPRLEEAVRFVRVPIGGPRPARAAAFRLWQALKRRFIYPAALSRLAKSHRTLLAVDLEQIPAWPHPASVVADVDDPVFSERELALLNLPQVRTVVVTTERARKRFEEIGVRKPIRVVPQGVSLARLDRARQLRIAAADKAPDDIVAGYHAPTLTLSADGADRPRDGLDYLDYLLGEFETARRLVPRLRLWLIGRSSAALERHARRRDWIRLFGYLPFEHVLDHVACFDLALYPRTYSLPPGRFSVKIAQYLALGLPVVSTSVEEAFVLAESGGGLVTSSSEFGVLLAELARSAAHRSSLGEAGRRYAESMLAWPALIREYREILA